MKQPCLAIVIYRRAEDDEVLICQHVQAAGLRADDDVFLKLAAQLSSGIRAYRRVTSARKGTTLRTVAL